MVPEPQYREPFFFKPRITILIMFMLLGMLATIQLNHQFHAETDKIRNVTAYRFLPTKLVSSKTFCTQLLPQLLLCGSLLFPQFTRALANPRTQVIRHHATNSPFISSINPSSSRPNTAHTFCKPPLSASSA